MQYHFVVLTTYLVKFVFEINKMQHVHNYVLHLIVTEHDSLLLTLHLLNSMSLNQNVLNEVPLAMDISNCDENKFRTIVYDFIERIAAEISLFDDDTDAFNLSASAFRHIELRIQARRIEKTLQLCIAQIRLIFFVSQLIEHQCDHLTLLFQPLDAECIKKFAKKWSQSNLDPLNRDFNIDLNECLDAANRTDSKFKVNSVILFEFPNIFSSL